MKALKKKKKKESLLYWTDYSKCYFWLNFNNFCFGEWKHFNLYPEWSISFDAFIWIPDELHCQTLATEPKKWLMLSNAWYLQCFWQGLVFTSWKIIQCFWLIFFFILIFLFYSVFHMNSKNESCLESCLIFLY